MVPAGVLVHYGVTEIAGFIGASSATLGFLVLPIAILARLVSLVAMFLVLRDGLRNLQEVAPLPESPVERRRTFLSALFSPASCRSSRCTGRRGCSARTCGLTRSALSRCATASCGRRA
ncbi:hypothetical protein JM654_20580 [Microbacterium oxydans]|nr:hypothetical protein [Microbacterium oxydans]